VVAKLNTSVAGVSAIKAKARATPVTGLTDGAGRQDFDFLLWLEAPGPVKERIDRVAYHFDHPTFINKLRESNDPSSGFAVSYRGWGCLALVKIDIHYHDARTDTLYFDMCNALSSDEVSH
jgi:hypothetical protein